MSGERDEKRRKKDQQRKDSIWKANFDSICIGLHQIFSGHQCRHLQKPSAQGAGDEEPELQHSSQPQPAHLLHSV